MPTGRPKKYFESGKMQQLKIYFLFMHADGEASQAEMKYLNDIVEKQKLSDSDKREFQSFCGEMLLEHLKKDSKAVIAEISRLLGERQSAGSVSFQSLREQEIDADKKLQAQTIWTLINLGYADDEYSEAEKEVVEHLINRWEMDPVLVSELKDTADTVLALTLQKNWIQATSKPYLEIDRIVKELDRNIASMFKNIEITISEANIV